MSIKEAVAKLAARAEADGYKFAYIFDAGRNLAILQSWSWNMNRSACGRSSRSGSWRSAAGRATSRRSSTISTTT